MEPPTLAGGQQLPITAFHLEEPLAVGAGALQPLAGYREVMEIFPLKNVLDGGFHVDAQP